MRFAGGMPGQNIGIPPNPVSGIGQAKPPDFSPIGGQGSGSNQYQNMPPWMNVTPAQNSALGNLASEFTRSPSSVGPWAGPGGSQMPNFNFQPIGPEMMQTPPVSAPWASGGTSPGVPGNQMSPGFLQNMLMEFMRSQNQQPQYMGSFAAGGIVPGGGTLGPQTYPGGYSSPSYAGPSASGGYIPGVNVPGTGGTYQQPSGPYYQGAGGSPFVGAQGKNFTYEQTMDPALTQNWFNFLQGNMGRGATPFNLQTQLPFGMGTTAPGQLNAPTNQILNNLFSGYTGGSFGNMPGMQTLKTIADQGISALPEWQATVAAEGQNIAATRNQLQESGAATGLAGTPTASAMSAYDQGTAAQQNAMLAQMQQQNILQGQIPAAEAMMQAGTQFGQYAQGLAQQNIQNMYNEFLRTRPEYSPLLGYESQASMAWNPWMQNPLPGGGIMGGIAGAAPGIMSTIGSMIPA